MTKRHTDTRCAPAVSGKGRLPGRPRPRDLLLEGVANARSQVGTTVTLIVVLAAVCFSILMTTGQSAASERAVINQIDTAGTRMIAISDDQGQAAISPKAVRILEDVSDVSWAFGLGEAFDVTNATLADQRAGARPLVGELPEDITLIAGRLPQAGEAIIGAEIADQLHIPQGYGSVTPVGGGAVVPVVGSFVAEGPLESLNATILVATPPEDLSAIRYLYVMATDVSAVERLGVMLETSTPANHPEAITVETPSGVIALREVVAGELGATSRALMAVVMIVGALIISVTMFGATTSKRRDFGRRRALGATRSALIVGLLVQTAVGALVGILIGCVGGLLILSQQSGELPAPTFTIGVAGLALLITLAAATPVALHAATRDPLRILRVP